MDQGPSDRMGYNMQGEAHTFEVDASGEVCEQGVYLIKYLELPGQF